MAAVPPAPQRPANAEARIAGHAIGVLAGVASLIGGVQALTHHMPPVLGVTMLLMSALLLALTALSFQHYSRIAWSFLSAILVVMALVTLFGSPKVRNLVHIPLGAAMVIPLVLIVGVIALYLSADDYRGTVSQKSQNAAR
ncbi:MAG TPA: hypothetical protein VMZ53_19765 [Kofleriaceae bacterium]|nr:hypothetical protein [Kofleriaceae bacterium]